MSESTNIIRPDNKNLLIGCLIAVIIGIIIVCLIPLVEHDGSKIVMGSIGGILIFMSLVFGYFAITIKLPGKPTIQEIELQNIAKAESHKGPNALILNS